MIGARLPIEPSAQLNVRRETVQQFAAVPPVKRWAICSGGRRCSKRIMVARAFLGRLNPGSHTKRGRSLRSSGLPLGN